MCSHDPQNPLPIPLMLCINGFRVLLLYQPTCLALLGFDCGIWQIFLWKCLQLYLLYYNTLGIPSTVRCCTDLQVRRKNLVKHFHVRLVPKTTYHLAREQRDQKVMRVAPLREHRTTKQVAMQRRPSFQYKRVIVDKSNSRYPKQTLLHTTTLQEKKIDFTSCENETSDIYEQGSSRYVHGEKCSPNTKVLKQVKRHC